MTEENKTNPEVKEEPKKGFTLTFSFAKISVALTAIIAIMTTIITFAVKFQTDKFKAINERDRAKYETKMLAKEKALKLCMESDGLTKWEKKYKEVAPEYLYLKYAYDYTVASNEYINENNERSLKSLKQHTKDFAQFVFVYRKKIISNTKDPILIRMEYSSEKIKFPRNAYLLPQPVMIELLNLQRGIKK